MWSTSLTWGLPVHVTHAVRRGDICCHQNCSSKVKAAFTERHFGWCPAEVHSWKHWVGAEQKRKDSKFQASDRNGAAGRPSKPQKGRGLGFSDAGQRPTRTPGIEGR